MPPDVVYKQQISPPEYTSHTKGNHGDEFVLIAPLTAAGCSYTRAHMHIIVSAPVALARAVEGC
jgi:hypothetical protein